MQHKESLGSVKLISINREEVLSELKKIALNIKQEHAELLDIKLFGSIAKSTHTGCSDIDIIIIVSSSSEDIFHRIAKLKRYFTLPISVDLLVYTKSEIDQMLFENNHFICSAIKEGIDL